MGHYRARVAYDGTAYSGFQIQRTEATIQGELEKALHRLTQSPVRIAGAGRTDAGVHAHGQVITFTGHWAHGDHVLQRALNAVLPLDISVRDVETVQESFHARFSAITRAYAYAVYSDQVRVPTLDRYAWQVTGPLDVVAMNRAASMLVGDHDFAAFGQPPSGENTVRIVDRAEWHTCHAGTQWIVSTAHELYRFDIEANAFLRGMVRRIVGTLVSVGTKNLSVAEFGDLLASADISRACRPAPACGLCLWRVEYPGDVLVGDEQVESQTPRVSGDAAVEHRR